MGVRGDKSTVGLFLGELFDVDAPLLTIDSLDLAFSSFVGSPHDLDHVSLAHGDRTNIILALQIFAQVGAHNAAAEG